MKGWKVDFNFTTPRITCNVAIISTEASWLGCLQMAWGMVAPRFKAAIEADVISDTLRREMIALQSLVMGKQPISDHEGLFLVVRGITLPAGAMNRITAEVQEDL